MNSDRYHPERAVWIGGGIAATLDIVYAILRNATNSDEALRILQSIASGWYGQAAFERGIESGAVGLLSHYGILFVAAALYYFVSQRHASLRTKPLVCGPLFGVLIYLFMNFVVLPVTAFPFHPKYPPLKLLEGFAVHAILVGLPIALAVRKWTMPVLRA